MALASLCRSPGTGFYSSFQHADVPYPEAIFELSFFLHNPRPFCTWAKEMFPGNYRPNIIHYFLRLLHDKGLLLRLYTQNIDGLERGEPASQHSSPGSARCLLALPAALTPAPPGRVTAGTPRNLLAGVPAGLSFG